MQKSITPQQIKQNNKNLIYKYIYKNQKVAQHDIVFDLRLSRPTVTTNLTALEQEGLIRKDGQMDTEYVGRKAAAYTIVPDYRIGIGIEILRKEVKMIAIDLYGRKIDRCVYAITFKNEDSYFEEICQEILRFKDSMKINDEQILSINFAIQGLVSPDHNTVVYGKILDCTGLSINNFTKYLPYPCSLMHDADSAAISELWVSQELKNAFYLSLSTHLGASIIVNRELLDGKHGHSSIIEHIQMEPHNGKLCYCGNTGCMETLCSVSSFLGREENLDDFFQKLSEGDADIQNRWHAYLKNLARAINLLHLIYDTDFILGGHLAAYIQDCDLTFLHEEIQKITPFPETSDFIHLSKMPKHNIAIGAALPCIQEFLSL